MAREGPPIPNPSKAPLEMMETEEITNPMLIIRRAELPAATVSALEENSAISCPGINQHRIVPAAIMQTESARETR